MRHVRDASKKMEKSRVPNALRAAVLGFSVLASTGFLPACGHRQSETETMQLVRSENPEERMRGAKALVEMHKNEPDALASLAMESPYKEVRLTALDKLGKLKRSCSYFNADRPLWGYDCMADIAIHSDYTDSAMAALEKTNPSWLIAISSKRPAVRLAAVKKLDGDAEALQDVLMHSAEYDDVKRAAADMLGHMLIKNDLKLTDWHLFSIAMYASDKDARMAAIRKLKDAHLLKEIATKSMDTDTVLAALKATGWSEDVLQGILYERKAHMEATLLGGGWPADEMRQDVSRMDDETKSAVAEALAPAVGSLQGQLALYAVFKYSKDENAKADAFKKLEEMHGKLSDENVLMAIAVASQNSDVRTAVVANICNPNLLEWLTRNSGYPDVRLAAVGKLKGYSERLDDIALDSRYEDARIAAAKRLAENIKESKGLNEITYGNNLHSLVAVAKASHGAVLMAAVDGLATEIDNITDTDVLKDIATYSQKAESRLAAAEKITSDYLLGEIAKYSEYADVGLASVAKLEDRYTLEQVAEDSGHEEVRLAVVKKFAGKKDLECLEDVAISSKYEDTRVAAVKELRGSVSSLVAVAENADGLTKRTAVGILASKVDVLTNPHALQCIAVSSQNSDARLAAVEKLAGNEKALKYVAKSSKYNDAKSRANELLDAK